MEKIGEGYYYDVYALSPTRVVKKQTSVKSRLVKLVAWYGRSPLLLFKKISQMKEASLQPITLSKRVSEIPELKEILGNPVFINDYEYEQDRAVPLGTILSSESEERFLAYVQEYIDAHVLLWEFGYSEVVYNFTLNAGVSAVTRKVILLDFTT